MAVKCIAIGNRIMRDDGIGIRIIEELIPFLTHENIEVIIGETDPFYTLNQIKQGDFVLILDATYFHTTPGTITTIPIDQALDQTCDTQHRQSLLSFMNIYQKAVDGYLIGIEADNIEFGLELSEILALNLQSISNKVYEFIIQTVRRLQR